MKLKSYFAATVEAAIEMARRELGEDALLMNARPTGPETRRFGAMEVVFGVPPNVPPNVSTKTQQLAFASPLPLEELVKAAAPAADGDMRADSNQALAGANPVTNTVTSHVTRHPVNDVAGLRQEMERMAEAVRLLSLGSAAAQLKHPAVYTRLLEAELDPELARMVAEGTPLEELFTVNADLGRADLGASAQNTRAVVLLVGPPGAGKTTTLVKLAARYGLALRRPTHIISTDVYRIAAADQLRTLASILGIGCTVVETAVALGQALEEQRGKELILIDSPGLTRNEMQDASDLAQFAAAHPEFDTHLVLPASMKPSDMARTVSQYEVFAPAKLLFTRLDETAHFGPLINEAARRGLPISFLSAGQQIPDHLEPATHQILTTLVLGRRVSTAEPRQVPSRRAHPGQFAQKSRAQGAGA